MSIYGEYVLSCGKQKSGNWCHKARWYPYHGGKRREKNFTLRTKAASKRAAEKHLEDLRRGEVAESGNSFESLVTDWRAERKDTCKRGTLAEYDRFIRKHIEPFFGDRKDVTSITPMDIHAFNQHLVKEGRSPTVRRQLLTILSGIFRFGVRNRLLNFDPTMAIKKPRPKTRDAYVLTKPQQQALLNAASSEKYKMLFALAMFSGLRQGELFGLRWRSVDFDRRVIIVREQFSNGREDTPKGNRSREVPLDNRTAEWLIRWRAICGGGEFVFSSRDDKRLVAKNMCKRQWRPALQKSGVKTEVEAAGHSSFRFHDLRHVYASNMLNSGASIYQLSRALGHASVTTTEKHYAHLAPGLHDELRQYTRGQTEGIEMDMGPAIRAVK